MFAGKKCVGVCLFMIMWTWATLLEENTDRDDWEHLPSSSWGSEAILNFMTWAVCELLSWKSQVSSYNTTNMLAPLAPSHSEGERVQRKKEKEMKPVASCANRLWKPACNVCCDYSQIQINTANPQQQLKVWKHTAALMKHLLMILCYVNSNVTVTCQQIERQVWNKTHQKRCGLPSESN